MVPGGLRRGRRRVASERLTTLPSAENMGAWSSRDDGPPGFGLWHVHPAQPPDRQCEEATDHQG